MARLLIDTHVLLWWLDGDKRLVRKPRQLVQRVLERRSQAVCVSTRPNHCKTQGADRW